MRGTISPLVITLLGALAFLATASAIPADDEVLNELKAAKADA